jgi:hypothetical protein
VGAGHQYASPVEQEMTIGSLIGEAWHYYHRTEDIACVVRPSVPILFFGDSERYFRSPLKVITVGLNPSRAEFPDGEPFARFRRAQHVFPGILSGEFYDEYVGALNAYFRCHPYRAWFNSFEPILNGMEASYYDGRTNAVLHTDLCSPLATNPTWSGLTNGRMQLAVEGSRLWRRLARHLAPDVILVSVARHYLGMLDFPILRDWETIYTIDRHNPYHVEAMEIEVTGAKRTLLVFGPASQKPFGKVSNTAKVEIGCHIAEDVHGQ